MKKIFIIMAILALTGCADDMSLQQAITTDPVGFMHGLWHGFSLLFSSIGSIFVDDIAIYAIYNNGGWYDFGYFLGVGTFVAVIN
jgi:hypothetical protein